ncbi:HNH endonuclease [Azorhizobium caulinodans]|uniref:HNH endonuclease n=1 Tax=Azorhizobium caulinodans TaxID=7 RepID=UPI002FBDEF27
MKFRHPPQETVKYWLNYEPEIGIFTWRLSPTPRIKKGQKAGGIRRNGYCMIGLRGHGQILAHRLAWIYVHGMIPDRMEIDHINRDPGDNRLENLRLATSSQQKMNKRVQRNSRSGLKGAYYHACRSGMKWRSQIKVGGKLIFLGYFPTAEDAHEAYVAASKSYFGEFHPDALSEAS